MDKEQTMRLLSDDELEMVSGGSTKAYDAAVALMKGDYGTGKAAQEAITGMGLDYWTIRHMANALTDGYGQVAQDVIDGKYGNDTARFRSPSRAGYDPILVQSIVNGMVLDD